MSDPTSEIYIQTVVTDNTNSDYPNAIVSIYWRLNSELGSVKTEREYVTNFSPVFDENFVSFSSVTDETMKTWIKSELGTKYTDLVSLTEQWVSEFQDNDTNKNYYFYNTTENQWQLQ